MDRNKEDLEELTKSATTSPTTPTTTTATTHNLTTTDDDTSTESSDTFETWTLVNDKENKLKKEILQDNGNRVEILKATEKEDEEEEETDLELKETGTLQQDSPLDDFSDGISIISESESVGRISPHPYLRDHLQDMNLKFSLSEHMDDIVLNKLREDMENEASATPLIIKENQDQEQQQQIRKRRKSSQEALNTSGEVQALQKASQTVAVSTGLTPFVKRGLQGIFYVGVALGILALIGKIVHPTWQPLSSGSSPSSEELQQKVNDMELQNNLMRAEIDLLNKQVKYLSSLNDPQQQQQRQGKFKDYKEGKTFKAWSGNGDTLKPVDITKQDLRKPYKCPDGSFVEIANMCVEKRHPHDPTIVEQFGQVVEDMKQQSEAFKTFEKVAEELQGFQDNPFEQLQEVFAEQQAVPAQGRNNRPIYQTPPTEYKDLPSREKGEPQQQQDSYKFSKYEKPQSKYEDNTKPTHKEYRKSYDQDDNNREFKKYPKSENFLDNSKEWKSTDKFNSKEKKYRKTKEFNDSNENSKENFSKERFNKQKRKYDKNNSHEHDDNNSGEWQQKYMKHREQQRKQNDQKYQESNKNWYIKRADSREKKRSSEKHFR